MSDTRFNYDNRLPYGLWYDKETDTEHLFDRDYSAIASRPMSDPLEVTIHRSRKHIGGSVQAWFYPSDSVAPWLNQGTLRRCEVVQAKFTMGMDVREYLANPGKKFSGCDGKFLPAAPSQDWRDVSLEDIRKFINPGE